MFRTADSNMTAVEIVAARYDGPIPADVLMQARAEDAAYRAAHPDVRPTFPPAVEEARMMVAYYAGKVRSMIAAKRKCDAAGMVNSAWHASELGSLFRAWRNERRRLATLLNTQAAG